MTIKTAEIVFVKFGIRHFMMSVFNLSIILIETRIKPIFFNLLRIRRIFNIYFDIWINGPQSTNPNYLKNEKSEHLIG